MTKKSYTAAIDVACSSSFARDPPFSPDLTARPGSYDVRFASLYWGEKLRYGISSPGGNLVHQVLQNAVDASQALRPEQYGNSDAANN